MKLKAGVHAAGLRAETLLAILVAQEVYRDLGHSLVVTSIMDGVHSKTSLHYSGYAVDLRTRDLELGVAKTIEAKVRLALGDDYDVVLENDHLHIEFDPV